MLTRLRERANWAFLAPKDPELRERFLARVRSRIEQGETGSLSSFIMRARKTGETAPEHQVPQWLFAFDAAGIATFRTLALLAAHPEQLERAWEEIRRGNREGRRSLPFLRACVLESLRLWPTTPLVLRETTAETEWETGRMPAHTHVLIFAPFFHRDDRRLPTRTASRLRPGRTTSRGTTGR